MRCPYLQGTGQQMFQCMILNKPCCYQHWCTHIKLYEITTGAEKCSVRRRERDRQK